MNGLNRLYATGALVAAMALLALLCAAAPAVMPTGRSFTNSVGMEFARIEPGEFVMGTPATDLPATVLQATEFGSNSRIWLPAQGDYDEHPAHRVRIAHPFYLGTVEVTNRQYERFPPLHSHLRRHTP